MTNTPPEPERLKIKRGPALGPIHFDPEGLLPGMPELPPLPELPEHHCITITNLTPEQFESIQAGIVQAMSDEKPSRTAKIIGKVFALAITMIVLAAALRAIVWILQGIAVR